MRVSKPVRAGLLGALVLASGTVAPAELLAQQGSPTAGVHPDGGGAFIRGDRDGPTATADGLSALTLGTNYHPTGNSRLQVDMVAHRVNGPAPGQGFDGARWIPILLTQLQLKF